MYCLAFFLNANISVLTELYYKILWWTTTSATLFECLFQNEISRVALGEEKKRPLCDGLFTFISQPNDHLRSRVASPFWTKTSAQRPSLVLIILYKFMIMIL